MSNEDVIAIQQQIVAKERAKRIAHERAMTRDIRSQMARSGWYQPDGDQPNPEYREYPKLIYLANDNRVVVNSRAEENVLLGKTEEPAKEATVDIEQLAAIEQAEPVRQKRKYTKRAQAPLPANLE